MLKGILVFIMCLIIVKCVLKIKNSEEVGKALENKGDEIVRMDSMINEKYLDEVRNNYLNSKNVVFISTFKGFKEAIYYL